MKQIIPYDENIVFKTKIAEISSISLEHEFNVDNKEVNGDFIISGDYKVHDVSVNKDPFLYRLPFSVTMQDNFDMETLDFEVRDFTYDVVDDDTLNINIEFSIEGEETTPCDPEYKEELKKIEEIKKEEKEPELIFEKIAEKTSLEDMIENPIERIDIGTQETIINTLNVDDDTFVTYHVHIVRDNETLETICNKYNASLDNITTLNNIEEINNGDKIIIPQTQNE